MKCKLILLKNNIILRTWIGDCIDSGCVHGLLSFDKYKPDSNGDPNKKEETNKYIYNRLRTAVCAAASTTSSLAIESDPIKLVPIVQTSLRLLVVQFFPARRWTTTWFSYSWSQVNELISIHTYHTNSFVDVFKW